MPDSFTRQTGSPGLFDYRLVRTDGGKLSLDLTLRELAEQIADFRIWGQGVAMAFYQAVEQQFATEGRFGGFPWAPLSEAYAEEKEQRYPNRGILERTGRLKRSLTQPPPGASLRAGGLRNRSGPDSTLRVSANELHIGTFVDYAGYHQKPYKGSRLKMRPPIPGAETFVLVMTEQGVQTLREVIEDTARR